MTPEILTGTDARGTLPNLRCRCPLGNEHLTTGGSMSTTTAVAPMRRTTDDTVVRWLPLAGAAFGLSQIAGNLVVGDFPDENTSPASLVRYYADHHADVQRGGEILAIGTVFLGLFVAALFVRCRHHFGAAAVIAVG